MNVCFVINRNYIGQLKTTVYSFYLNNRGNHFFYVMESDLQESDYLQLKEFVSKIGCEIKFYKIDNEIFKNAKKMKSDFSYTTYYKFFIFKYLSHLPRVLYLDCDIVVNHNIESFYNAEYKNILVVNKDKEVMRSNKKHIKLITGNKKNNYFNAGVILFNLNNYKEYCNKYFDDLLNFLNNNAESLTMHDQDVFNSVFYNKVDFVSNKYNFFAIPKSFIQVLLPISFKKDKYIIHYVGFKPWKKGYVGLFKRIYKKYYKLTKNITEINYFEKYSLLYKIKNTLIVFRTRFHRLINWLLRF